MSGFKLYGSTPFKNISQEDTTNLLIENTKESRNKVFEGNLSLVSFCVDKYFQKLEDKEELFQVGCIGLLKAISYFDVSKELSFSTYAVPMIIGEIKRYVRENTTIRISRGQTDLIYKIRRLKEAYENSNTGQELSNEEIAKLLDISLFEVEDAFLAYQDNISLDQEIFINTSKDSKVAIHDIIKDYSINIEEQYDAKETLEFIYKKMDKLSERDRKIVDCYYGIKTSKKTQMQIANIFNISQAQVSRIAKKFKDTCLKELNYEKVNKISQVKNIKKQPKVLKETLYEELNKYSSQEIDEELEKLEKEKKEILKKLYDKTVKLSYSEKAKAKSVLKELTFNLAMRIVKTNQENNKVNKENNIEMDNNKNIKKKKLSQFFPDTEEKEILSLVNNLPGKEKDIFILYFGLSEKGEKTIGEISQDLGIKVKSISNQLYSAQKRVQKWLNEKNGKKTTNENYEDISSVTKVKDLIISGKYDPEKKNFSAGINTIKVEINLADCSIASVKDGVINKKQSISKKCYIYRIIVIDGKGNVKRQQILLKDKNIKKYYEYADGNYNTIKDGLVCYKIENEVPIEIVDKTKDNDAKQSLNMRAQKLYSSAIGCYERKNYIEAEEYFNKVLKLSIDDDIICNSNKYLGAIYHKKKKFLIAEKHYKDALIYDKEYFTLINLSTVLREQSKYEEALNVIAQSYNFSNGRIEHIIEKAKIYEKSGKPEIALRLLDKCNAKNKKAYMIHLEKAKILYNLKRINECLIEVNECEKLRKGFNEHLILKGKIEYLNGNEEEALKIFDKCVDNDQKSEVMYSIIEIGYFFHKLNNKELAYKYYNEAPMFQKWANLTEQEINNHFNKHKNNNKNEKMHSIFNKEVSMEMLNEFVSRIDKVGIKQLYDVYQIYWPNIGTMMVDDKTSVDEDYLTIFTLPFSKKVMMSYPDLKFDGELLNEPVNINDLISTKKEESIVEVDKKQEDDKLSEEEEDNMLVTNNDKNGIYAKFRNSSNEDIDEAISALSEEKRKFILGYYDGNFNNKISRKKMSEDEIRIYNSIMTFIKRRLENTHNFYSKFVEFSKEEVESAIIALCDDKEIEILKKYHNGNLEKPIVSSSLTDEEKYRYGRLVINIHNKLNRTKQKKDLKSENEKEVKEKQKRTTSKSDNKMLAPNKGIAYEKLSQNDEIKTETLIEEKPQDEIEIKEEKKSSNIVTAISTKEKAEPQKNVKNNNDFTKADYIKMLDLLRSPYFENITKNLPKKDSIIISLAFGCVDGKYFSIEAISNFLQIDQKEVRNIIKTALVSYRSNLVSLFDKAIEDISNKTI